MDALLGTDGGLITFKDLIKNDVEITDDGFKRYIKFLIDKRIDIPFGIWVFNRKVLEANALAYLRVKCIVLFGTPMYVSGVQDPFTGKLT